MSKTSQRLLRFGAVLVFASALLLALYQRSDAAALLLAFGPVLVVGVPVSGLACLAAALVSPRVRSSVKAHPILYIGWAIAGCVVICLVVSAVVATARARYGHYP
jgi:hypothetical protein